MVIGEAMAAGLPVICSNHTGAPDFVVPDETGFIIPACDSPNLADRIKWSFENQKTLVEMGSKGQKIIADHTWDTYGENIYSCYSAIIV